MADSPQLMNEPEARMETGEIKPQDSTTPESTSSTNPETTPKEKTEPSTETLLTKKDAEAAGAPEKYEDFKVPDGIELKGEQLEAATKLFKEMNLDQASAQRLVDFHAAQLKAVAEGPLAEYEAMRSDWKSKAEAHPDIGPMDGAKAKEIRTTIGRALDALGDKALSDDFKSAMNLTGVGDHPAFIRAFAKFASKFVEGRPADMSGAHPSPNGQASPDAKPATIASAMYPYLPA